MSPDNLLTDDYEPDRALCLLRAAVELASAVNGTPGTDGTTVLAEIEELRHGNAPGDYLDDLEARVGVDVDAARAFYTLATAPADEFEDLWHSVESRYTMPVQR